MKSLILAAAVLVAAAVLSVCLHTESQTGAIILKADNVRTIERDTANLWCNAETCSAVSGDTVRVRWVIPKNSSRSLRTYELHHNGLLFKTIVRDPGAKKMTWRTELFQQHKNQRKILLAAILQQPPHTVLGDVAANASLTLTQGGAWSVYAWVDECRRQQWPCRAPVSYLAHRW